MARSENLVQAKRRVQQAEKRTARQKALAGELAAHGHARAAATARRLLGVMAGITAQMRQQVQRMARKPRPPR
jgi:hypothetical protein